MEAHSITVCPGITPFIEVSDGRITGNPFSSVNLPIGHIISDTIYQNAEMGDGVTVVWWFDLLDGVFLLLLMF